LRHQIKKYKLYFLAHLILDKVDIFINPNQTLLFYKCVIYGASKKVNFS